MATRYDAHMNNILAASRDADPIHFPKGYDLVEIPLEGVAAYWLSICRVLKTRKAQKFLQGEVEHIDEPYIRHLLEIGFASFDQNQIRRLAGIKKETILKDLRRKLIIMSIAVLGMATNENPQQVLIRILSKFPMSPVLEKEVFTNAQELLIRSEKGLVSDGKEFDVNHRMDAQELIVNLLFYTMLSRRKDATACSAFIESIRSAYFVEGLTLIIDGFDYDFIKHRLNLQKVEILDDTQAKMDMALEMCIGIKNNLSYEDVFKIAKSFML